MRLTNYISAVCRDILEGCVLKLSGLFSSSPVYVASYLTINSCVYKEVLPHTERTSWYVDKQTMYIQTLLLPDEEGLHSAVNAQVPASVL